VTEAVAAAAAAVADCIVKSRLRAARGHFSGVNFTSFVPCNFTYNCDDARDFMTNAQCVGE